jgi:WD40 repeat protein
VAFSPDGRYILTGSDTDETAHLWDLQEPSREVQVFPDLGGLADAVAFSPDGTYLLTATGDITTLLWDLRQPGQPLGSFGGDNVAFSPDGQYFLTGGFKTAWLWDTATRTQRRAFGATDNLSTVAYSPDGQFVLLAGSDRVARLWDTDYQTLVNSVCARLLRDFTDEERAQYLINDQQPTCRTK